MAWPDTADFPEGWSFPVGFDGTDYDGTWVLDVPNAKPGKAAALKAVWADNDWAVIQTTSFVLTTLDIVSVQVKPPSSYSGEMTVRMLILDEDGVSCGDGWWTTDWAAWNSNYGSGYGGLGMSINSPKFISVGKRYTLLIAVKKMVGGSEFYLGDCIVTGSASAGFESAEPRPVTFFPDVPSAPPGQGGSDWPGPLDSFTGLPAGWQFDDEGDLIASEFTPSEFSYPVGSNGIGTSLNLNIAGTYAGYPLGFNGWWPVSPAIPAHATVSFKYQGWFSADVYEAGEGAFTYEQNYLDSLEAPALVDGWRTAQYEVGDVSVQLMFNPRVQVHQDLIFGGVVGNQRYFALLDDFQVQPLTVSDGDASDEVGMVVGGVFRWEPTVMVEDSAAAAESVMGVPYTGWTTDPEWPIWHAGSPTYLPPTDPGTAWDFLDDVAYGDQDYGVGVSGTIVIRASASLTDAGVITDELDAPNEPVLEGRAIAFDQHEPLTIGPSLAVLADGDELASLFVVASVTIDQDVQAVEVPTLQFTATVEDVAAADEVATGTTSQVEVSAGVADQDVIPGAAVDLLLVEDAQALELVEPGAAAMVEGDAAGFEDATPAAVLPLLVSEAQATTEVADQADAPPAALEGMASATDELLAQVTSAAALESAAVAEDLALYAQPGAVALVMNTETAAVSWYENWQFTDMAQVGNTVLAIGPEGLAVLGGNTDAGDRISASLAWGYRDFGSEQKKRVDSFWFGYSATGLLQVGVQTFGQGYGRFVYRMENRQATKGRNNRVTPGKGLNARYWKVDLSNVSGCAFDVDSMGVDLLNSTRRI
ncbi:MAG: hypothetical protein ACKOWC_03965 [Limnohabitans sp.]